MKNVFSLIALLVLPIWWIFTIIWQPSFIAVLTSIAYRFEPPTVSIETTTEARQRALRFSTTKADIASDIIFTPDELSHLADVKRLYTPHARLVHFAGASAWVVLLAAVLRKDTFEPALKVAWKFYTGLFVLTLLALLFFSVSFIWFHEVLFPQGNWSFPADSLLIQTFPETFWKLMLGVVVSCFRLAAFVFRFLSNSGFPPTRE